MQSAASIFVKAFAPIFLLSFSAVAAEPVGAGLESEAPPQIAAPAQRWLAHQDWHCVPNKAYDPKEYILGIRGRMNTLGQLGWEVVNFEQVSIANRSCYVVTFKTPYELKK